VPEERVAIPKLEGYHCFACGTANPIGLNLHFYRSGDSVCSDITLGPNHVGWQNMAHGGIISTLLDEVTAWAIIYFKRVFFVTRKMDVKYVKPVLIDVPLSVRAKILGVQDEKYVRAVAKIFDDRGHILARGNSEFVILSSAELALVPEGLKQDMLALFKRLAAAG
jgi:acyl-coenzyme A thioesterase PaaI-like protein